MENNTNKDEEFFKLADETIQQVITVLKTAKNKLDFIYNTHQRVSDLNRGLIFKKGLFLPYGSFQHRILFEGYEVQFLDIFTDFYDDMSKGGENLFKEFAIRTIAEMGLKDMQILFGPDLSEKDKAKFKTIIMLGDYASLAFNHSRRANEFRNLFKDQKHLLTEKQLLIFEEVEVVLKTKDHERHKKVIKKIRKLVDSTRSDLYLKTKTPKVFRSENVEAFFSAFSHLIHANVLLLTDLFSEKRPTNRNRLRYTWTLLMTGINTYIHVNDFLKKKGVFLEADNLLENFEKASKEVAAYWARIENGK